MSVEVFASINAAGDQFSPKAWETSASIICKSKTELGELQSRGQFKGQLAPRGFGLFELSSTEASQDLFKGGSIAFWSRLQLIVEAARQLHADDLDLSITIFYKGQCNFAFDTTAIAGLYRLGVPLLISCVEDKG